MTKPTAQTQTRIQREARLMWVPIPRMKVNPTAQRQLNKAWVDHLAATFDPEELGNPLVNLRDDNYYIIDGQHRIEMLKQIGWGDQNVQCWCYEGLTEEQEAEKFLKHNDSRSVDTFAKFKVGVRAGRPIECDIDRVVRLQGLVVSKEQVPGAIRPVGALRKVYTRSNGATLGRTLRITRDAFGDAGFKAPVISGLGLLCQRYNGTLDDDLAIKALGDMHGGVNGLLNLAELKRKSTGLTKEAAVAAVAVERINKVKPRGAKRLPDWIKAV